MVLIIGDEPSKSTHPNRAFEGAKCEARLKQWISNMHIADYVLINSHMEHILAHNIEQAIVENWPVITLGKLAKSRVVKAGCLKFFGLPHPSGRNLQINDKEFIQHQLEECSKYVQNMLNR